MTYKVLKHLNRINKDTIEINKIEDQIWINHYKNLWCTNSPQNDNDEPQTTITPSAGIDEISGEELQQSPKSMKNRKGAGPVGLKSELFKCGRPVLSNRVLQLINSVVKKALSKRSGDKQSKILIQKS
jgi:hypothetical protein